MHDEYWKLAGDFMVTHVMASIFHYQALAFHLRYASFSSFAAINHAALFFAFISLQIIILNSRLHVSANTDTGNDDILSSLTLVLMVRWNHYIRTYLIEERNIIVDK